MNPIAFAEAKKDFDRGLITHAWLERQPMADAWVLHLSTKLKEQLYLVGTREREIRQFRSLDAALNMLRQIGFETNRLDVH